MLKSNNQLACNAYQEVAQQGQHVRQRDQQAVHQLLQQLAQFAEQGKLTAK